MFGIKWKWENFNERVKTNLYGLFQILGRNTWEHGAAKYKLKQQNQLVELAIFKNFPLRRNTSEHIPCTSAVSAKPV